MSEMQTLPATPGVPVRLFHKQPEPTAAKSSRCGAPGRGQANDHGHHQAASNGPSTKVIDPVCGMTVDPATSKHRFDYFEAKPIIFCSAGCRTKFAAAPEQYLDKSKPKAEAPEGTIYICLMHPQIRQVGPAAARSAAWRWSRRSPAWTRRRTLRARAGHDAAVLDRPCAAPPAFVLERAIWLAATA